MALFTYYSSKELVSPELITQLNFIPMVCVILAYTGYGLGYGVIPSLIAAELMPVEIRYCVQQLQPFLQYIAQIYCGGSTHDTRNDINVPTLKTKAGTYGQLGYPRSLHYVCRYCPTFHPLFQISYFSYFFSGSVFVVIILTVIAMPRYRF